MLGETKTFPDLDGLSSVVAQDIHDVINKAVAERGIFHLALSGGNTPRTLYHILGTTHQHSIPWTAVHIFFCDERYVPHGDEHSNYRMVKENLLDLIPVPQKNIHPVPTDLSDPDEAARTYEEVLRKNLPNSGNSFDLVLLGMGKEGHTASLFPGSEASRRKKSGRQPWKFKLSHQIE